MFESDQNCFQAKLLVNVYINIHESFEDFEDLVLFQAYLPCR